MRHFFKKILTLFDIEICRIKTSELFFLRSYGIETVFDIGANVGQFAKEIRRELPYAQIYSFEPVKETYAALVKNFSDDTKFRAFPVGLGSRKEKKEIRISAYSPSSSFLPQSEILKTVFPHTKETGVETVSIERLDDIWREVGKPRSALVKMDTQGFEAEVISAGKECLRASRMIIIETSFVEIYTGQPLFGDIYESLKKLGFSYHGSLRAKRNPKTGEVMFEDSIFVRSEH